MCKRDGATTDGIMRHDALGAPLRRTPEGGPGMWFNCRMKPAFPCVALIGKYQSADIAESVRDLADCLGRSGRDVLIEEETAEVVGAPGSLRAGFDDIGARASVAIILGGDGTLLTAARRLAVHGVPLIGVNQGRLGFLTDVPRASMRQSVCHMLDGHYREERRSLLSARVEQGADTVFSTVVLNDVVLSKGDLGRMIEFEVQVNDEFVYSQRSDGLIVTTPTGSTAYSLSANGPILHPSMGGFAVVPLCPHALSSRPIVLGDDAQLSIRLLARHEARVHFDGQDNLDLPGDACVRIARSPRQVSLLHPPGYSYFAMLREKLHWSEAPKEF